MYGKIADQFPWDGIDKAEITGSDGIHFSIIVTRVNLLSLIGQIWLCSLSGGQSFLSRKLQYALSKLNSGFAHMILFNYHVFQGKKINVCVYLFFESFFICLFAYYQVKDVLRCKTMHSYLTDKVIKINKCTDIDFYRSRIRKRKSRRSTRPHPL